MGNILKVSSFFVGMMFLIVTMVVAQSGKAPVADARVGFLAGDSSQKYLYTLINEEIYFDGSRSFDQDSGGGISGHYWDFGDGFTEVGAQLSHRYSSPGKYTVRLMVRDNEGQGSLVPSEVEIFVNDTLEVQINLPQRGGFISSPDNRIKFSGEGQGGTPCYDSPHYRYRWYSDVSGLISDEAKFSLPATLPLGWHHITLVVIDCLGKMANRSVDISIITPLEAEITESCEEISSGDSLILGRVVIDSSWLRFVAEPPLSLGDGSCNNSRYVLNIAQWLDQNGRILIYTSGEINQLDKLKTFLKDDGYSVDVAGLCCDKLDSSLLSGYGQVWFLDTTETKGLNDLEIAAVVEYRKNRGNLLLSGGAADNYASQAVMVSNISEQWDIEMNDKLDASPDANNCFSPLFYSHPITAGVSHLSTSGQEVLINPLNAKARTVSLFSSRAITAVLDYEIIAAETSSYLCDCEVKLAGRASGGTPPYEVKWISLEDGVIDSYWIKDSGGSYSLLRSPNMLAPLSEGTHTLRFEIIDSLGTRTSDTRYEVQVKWCCALDATCQTYWPEKEGPLTDTGNERSHSCDIWEVCHPDLWPLAREAVECCKDECQGDCHDSCQVGYDYGAELGTTPEGLSPDGLKRCSGLYLIYGLGPEARYMSGYFFPEVCCIGYEPVCLMPEIGCCEQDLGRCRCSFHVYTKNQQALSCAGMVSSSPGGWRSDAAMSKNSCTFSDLAAHMSILGDEGIVTEASGINTGTCCDYSIALTTLARLVGYRPEEIYSIKGPGHCYNLILFPGEARWHIVDTTGNNFVKTSYEYKPWIKQGNPLGGTYCAYYNCVNDRGTFSCPKNTYGC